MRIIEYFGLDPASRAHWRGEIGRADWPAARFLCEMLEAGTVEAYCGGGPRLLLAAEEERLTAFCALTERDEIRETALGPWIGFVYTYPEYRGRRLSGRLIEAACDMARADGHASVYISTNHAGLYEKYGFAFLRLMRGNGGDMARVYRRPLA